MASLDHNSLKSIQEALSVKEREEKDRKRIEEERKRLQEIEYERRYKETQDRINTEMPERMILAEQVWKWMEEFRTTDLCLKLFEKSDWIEIYKPFPSSWSHFDIHRTDSYLYARSFAKWAGTVTDATYQNVCHFARSCPMEALRRILDSLRPGGQVYELLQKQALS